ncbi:ATP-binding protein [Streptomyces sp. NPDC004838]
MEKDSFGEDAGRPRAERDPGTPDFGRPSASEASPARTVRIVSGDLLLTVNPVDGSEIEPCPPGGAPEDQGWPSGPRRRTKAERAEAERLSRPPAPAGPAAPRLALLERDDARERLIRLLGRGRSVRLTGPAGSGRTALLDLVARDCADLAPDGVVRLNGLHRTATELLYELFAAVHKTPRYRLGRAELLTRVREIGAVVVLDDLEFGGTALGELLDAAPECAFLLAVTPDVPEPAAGAHLEEIGLDGLSRAASLELLARAVDRLLTEDETNWAGDLWFESEGLPLRFIQAGALLRQCDELRSDPDAVEDSSPFEGARNTDVALPTLGQGAAPAALLASRLSPSARQTLRFAVALGGEVPHQAHLPALIGDTHADAALGELMGCGLLSPVGGRYRLAAGAATQLTEKGYADEAATHARTAARHYAWWAGHPSVAPERAAGEADAVLAALTTLVQSQEAGRAAAAVLLARTAAPAFAAGLHWGAWERALRVGSEAARIAGEVAEEAYFHHELGVLAICGGNPDRARAELEASIGMRGALADKKGTVAGRRALALVADRENGRVPAGDVTPAAAARNERADSASTPLALPPGPLTGIGPPSEGEPPTAEQLVPATLVPHGGPYDPGPYPAEPYADGPYNADADGPYAGGPKARRRLPLLRGARRNLAAAGVGALLAAVLGTAATLAATSDKRDAPGTRVGTGQSASEDDSEQTLDAEEPVSQDLPPTEPARVPARVGVGSTAPGFQPPARPSRTAGKPSPGPSRPQKPSPDAPPGAPGTGKPPTSTRPPGTGSPTSESPSGSPSDTPSLSPSSSAASASQTSSTEPTAEPTTEPASEPPSAASPVI